MKIDYRIVGSGGGYTTLMDGAVGDTIEPWEPSYSAAVQVDKLAGNVATGGSVKIKPQGNVECSLPMHAMAISYASPAAAFAASRTVTAAMLNNAVNFRVVEGGETQYFPNAVCVKCIPNVQGSGITWNMDFVCKMVTSIEPS